MSKKTGAIPTREDMRLVQEIYERYKGVMYRTALESIGPSAEADEIVSEALLQLARYAGRLKGLESRALAVYVQNTVRTTARMAERRRRREEHRLLPRDPEALDRLSPAPGPEEDFIEGETRALRAAYLREALAELSDTDRNLLVWKHIDGVSDEEIARRLGLKPGSIRVRLTRARQRVRAIILRKEAGDEAGTSDRSGA